MKNVITVKIKNLVRNYIVQIYENKVENPDELDTFFEIHENPIGDQISKITMFKKEIEKVFKDSSSPQNNQSLVVSGNSSKYLKIYIVLRLLNYFCEMQYKKNLWSNYKLIPNNGGTKERKTLLMNIDVKYRINYLQVK